MPVFKEILTKRFWASVLLILVMCAVIDAVGGFLFAKGMITSDMTGRWAWIAWGIAAYIGARFVIRGKEGTVPRALFVSAVAYGTVLIVALLVPGNETLRGGWLGNAIGAVAGALIAGIIKPGKMHRKKGGRSGRQSRGKIR